MTVLQNCTTGRSCLHRRVSDVAATALEHFSERAGLVCSKHCIEDAAAQKLISAMALEDFLLWMSTYRYLEA